MGAALSNLLALVLGSFFCYSVLRMLVTAVADVRRAWALRTRGLTATATIVSLADIDPESSTRRAVVRFEVESGREVTGAADLRWKGRPDLVPGAQVQIRYDPETPKTLAPEAGPRQGHAEIRQALAISAMMLVLVLPTSILFLYAGLRALLP